MAIEQKRSRGVSTKAGKRTRLLSIIVGIVLASVMNAAAQTIKVVKPDGDFACKITAADKLVVKLECADTTRLIVPRAGWPPAWGEMHTVWDEEHLVGQTHYAQRKDGRLTAVTHSSKLHPCAITECQSGERRPENKCRCDVGSRVIKSK